MGVSDENFPDVMNPSNGQGVLREIGGKEKLCERRNRNPLSTLDTNIVPVARLRKRGLLTGQNEVADKANVLGHMAAEARKLPAVQMAEKQKRTVVEDRQLPPLRSDKSKQESENCCVNVVTKNSRLCDQSPAPMVVQHAEAILEENDQMDVEIEMEDDEDELVMDIDSADKNNPLAVVEYIDDLYAYYKKLESSSCVPPNYMLQQLDINERMRGILIDWLIEVHYKFELMEETLYLTVNLIDRYLAIQKVVRKKLQLVGVTAMLLACKYEEVYVPVVEDLILISDKAYTRNEILDMERSMTFSLQFNLSTPTPYVFMRRFLKAARADRKLELLSFFMIELCVVEYEMLEFPPSLLAAAAVFTAQATLTGATKWCKTCEKHTNYSEDQLLECSRLMVSFHEKASSGKLTGVHRKYSTSKYGYAAKTEAAHFLLES